MNVVNESVVLEKIMLNVFLILLLVYYIVVWRFIAISISVNYVYGYLIVIFPAIMYLPWLLVILHNYETLVHGIKLFRHRIRILSMAHKAFYTILTLFVAFVIIIPSITPLVMIAVAFYFPYLVTMKIKLLYSKRSITLIFYMVLSAITFTTILIILIPFYTIFLREAFKRSLSLIRAYLSLIFDISMCIGASAGIGSFIKLIYQGAREYDRSVIIPQKGINALELFLAVAFTLIYILLKESFLVVTSMFLFLSPITTMIKRIKGLNVSESSIDFVSGIIFIVFALTSLFFSVERYDLVMSLTSSLPHIELIVVLIAAIMFLMILIISIIDYARKK